MSRTISGVVGGLALVLCLTSQLAAQDGASRRQGFWFNIGFGYATADWNCDNCGDTSRESSIGGHLALGGTLSERLLLGVESDGWYKEEGGIKNTLSNLTFAAYYYPSPTTPFFLKGGVGLSYYKFSNGGSVDDTGLGFMAGGGYDISIGAKTSITPTITFNYGALGDNEGAEGVTQNWVTIGAAFTLH